MTKLMSSAREGAFTQTNLYFTDNCNQWLPLPSWGNFFINIGRWLAENDNRKNRLVLALAIPTRNYAAALAASGVVLARVNIPIQKIDTKRHFKHLCNLPKGTSVFYCDGKKRYKGIYRGIDVDNGERRLRIQREDKSSGGLTNLVSFNQCHNIVIAPQPNINLPKKQSGTPIITHNDFLDGLIGKSDTREFITKTRLDCAVIGCISNLQNEILEIPFANCSSPSTSKKGCLQDILRVRNFLSSGQAYRSEILLSQLNKPLQTTDGLIPYATIFDGANSFIKWRDDWRNSHWIILLERTETHFKDAVNIIDYEYIDRLDEQDLEEIPNIMTPPSGVEMIVYQEPYQ